MQTRLHKFWHAAKSVSLDSIYIKLVTASALAVSKYN